jgi:hypothetical protein
MLIYSDFFVLLHALLKIAGTEIGCTMLHNLQIFSIAVFRGGESPKAKYSRATPNNHNTVAGEWKRTFFTLFAQN